VRELVKQESAPRTPLADAPWSPCGIAVHEQIAHGSWKDEGDAPMNSYEMTREFHRAFGLPVADKPRVPSVEERLLRAKLLFEECMETIEKGLGVRVFNRPLGIDWAVTYNTEFEIDSQYDPVETLDGLADVKVIANGTAVQFGLPMEAADREVFESNMSKLGEDGKPIVNKCELCSLGQPHGRDICELVDPTQPLGKILKGPHYRKPNIEGLLK
jgi:predicted HAD superfamily Cof-like phosphohydrolase